jgi:hypothetical protein
MCLKHVVLPLLEYYIVGGAKQRRCDPLVVVVIVQSSVWF